MSIQNSWSTNVQKRADQDFRDTAKLLRGSPDVSQIMQTAKKHRNPSTSHTHRHTHALPILGHKAHPSLYLSCGKSQQQRTAVHMFRPATSQWVVSPSSLLTTLLLSSLSQCLPSSTPDNLKQRLTTRKWGFFEWQEEGEAEGRTHIEKEVTIPQSCSPHGRARTRPCSSVCCPLPPPPPRGRHGCFIAPLPLLPWLLLVLLPPLGDRTRAGLLRCRCTR